MTASTTRRWRLLAMLAVLSLTFTTFATGASADSKKGIELTILHNNDGESQLIDAGEGLEDFGGVARFATVVSNAKKDAKKNCIGIPIINCGWLMVSSGDNFLAGPEFNASVDAGVFYDAMALDMLGYDAIALGNHDFDFGPELLADFISTGFREPGRPPYVSANLDFSGEPDLQALFDAGVITKSTIVKERGRKIGIVGATTPELFFISSPGGVVVDPDVAAAVQAEVDDLTAAGAKIIVMISHLQDINADIALAGELSGVDVMVAGGGDEVLANPDDLLVPGDTPFGAYPQLATGADGATIPVVTTAGDYKYLGALTVEFDADGNAVAWDGGPIRVAGGDNPDAVRPDRRMMRKVVAPVAAFVAALGETVIGTSEVALEGRRDPAPDPGIRTGETNLGNLMADALRWQAEQAAGAFGVPVPDVGLQNGGGIRNNTLIPPGPITELTTFDIAPFPNFVTITENVDREAFRQILERAVSARPGVSGRFAQVSGFSFTYSLAGTAQELNLDGTILTPGSRVTNITLDAGGEVICCDGGGAVFPGADLTVASIDFLAGGGDGYPFFSPFTRVGFSYQQALSNYIQDGLGGVITAADYPEGGEGRITETP